VGDSVFWLALFNTLFYTVVASVLKFGSACGWRCC
jgi:ABC-type sugar transport system permease subunit